LFGNKCRISLVDVITSKNIYRATKCILYKTVIYQVVTLRAETWFIKKSAKKNTNDLRKEDITEKFQTSAEGNQWRIRMKVELEKL
jgi:hypothetical protein